MQSVTLSSLEIEKTVGTRKNTWPRNKPFARSAGLNGVL